MDRLASILSPFTTICGSRRNTQASTITAADTSAQNVVNEIKYAEKSGQTLEVTINDIAIQAGGWSEYLAERILRLLEGVLKAGKPIGEAMRHAYDKSVEAVERLTIFAKDHPVLCTAIALGILAIMVPVVITALGFTCEGVAAGELKQNTSMDLC
jgi:hypothetical protein